MNQTQYDEVKALLNDHLVNAMEAVRSWERRREQDDALIEEFNQRAAGYEDAIIMLAQYALEKGLTP